MTGSAENLVVPSGLGVMVTVGSARVELLNVGPDISGLDLGASTFVFAVALALLFATPLRLGDPADKPWYLWKRFNVSKLKSCMDKIE